MVFQIIGRFHILLLHLPIGILILAFLFEWVQHWKIIHIPRETKVFTYLVGCICAVFASITGYMLSQSGDYANGIVYIATDDFGQKDFGTISYNHNNSITEKSNVMVTTEAYRRFADSDIVIDAVNNYEKITNTSESIIVSDLESSISFDDNSLSVDQNNVMQRTNVVLSNYTVVLENRIKSISVIMDEKFLYGSGLSGTTEQNRIPDASSSEILGDSSINL